MIIPAEIAAAIIAHAQACCPEEACGLVAGEPGRATALYPGRNISPTPCDAYELDYETLARLIEFEDAGLKLVAIYHSHPLGPSGPSQTDVLSAFYPDAVYLICDLADPTLPALRGFRIGAGRISEVGLDIPPAIS